MCTFYDYSQRFQLRLTRCMWRKTRKVPKEEILNQSVSTGISMLCRASYGEQHFLILNIEHWTSEGDSGSIHVGRDYLIGRWNGDVFNVLGGFRKWNTGPQQLVVILYHKILGGYIAFQGKILSAVEVEHWDIRRNCGGFDVGNKGRKDIWTSGCLYLSI